MAIDYPEWQRLRELLARIKAEGFSRLSAEEIIEFGKWYRRVAAELSYQRTRDADPARIAFLNNLYGECYAYVYTGQRHPWPSVVRFFTVDFPRTYRKHAIWMVIAMLAMMIPAIIGFVLTWRDSTFAAQVLPPEFFEGISEQVARHEDMNDWLPVLEGIPTSSFLMTNNIRVSILAYAGGMTAGLLTLFLMVTNGLMLGIIGAGVGLDSVKTATGFWGFVAPHGVIELSAIYIAGGAGLVIAYALVNPGVYPRRIALRHAGKDTLILMLGVAAMLVIAGLVEAFFSPRPINPMYKFIVAAFLGTLLYGYLLLAGRKVKEHEEAPERPRLMTPLPPV